MIWAPYGSRLHRALPLIRNAELCWIVYIRLTLKLALGLFPEHLSNPSRSSLLNPTMSGPTPVHDEDEMMMPMDEDIDAEGEDQLIDDDTLSTLHPPRQDSGPQSHPLDNKAFTTTTRRRIPPSTSQAAQDKSARKREQREREKEQQKQLLAKLIEIFGT